MNRRRYSSRLNLLTVAGLLFSLTACSYLPSFHKKPDADQKPAAAGQKPSSQGLVFEMHVAPEPLKLAESRQLEVTLNLRNVTRKKAQLKFPTTQVIEILLRDAKTNQIVTQWSSDQSFTADPRLLIINPEEMSQYKENVATRDLKAGTLYLVEAYVVGFQQELRATKAILAQP